MGAVQGLIGGANNITGGFAPVNPNLINSATEAQADTAYGQTQQGLAQQQAFVNALQAQNGVQNQSNVFNQLQGVANGTGPNPAQAMLNQSTGQNVANQAALMAGQRGAGANTGLIARQAAMQGANLQQQAVGQGATMQAQQSLGALNQLGGIAGQQVNNQAGAIQGYNQAAQGQQANILNGIAQQNNARLGAAGQANAQNNLQTQANRQMAGQLLQGAGQAGSMLARPAGGLVGGMFGGGGGGGSAIPTAGTQAGGINFAGGGQVNKMADGGNVPPSGAQSSLGQFLTNKVDPNITPMPQAPFPPSSGGEEKKDGGGDLMKTAMQVAPFLLAGGGKVPALVSPGEVYLSPKDVRKVEQGKKSPLAGEKIPGKAKVKGDSLKNDTVPKTLEEGGIVLPKSVTEHPHAGWEAKKFIDAIRKKKGSLG